MNLFYIFIWPMLMDKTQKPKPQAIKPLLYKKIKIGITAMVVMFSSSPLFSAVDVKGQTLDQVTISLELDDESLKAAFQKIEAQTDFYFMYRNEDVKDIHHLKVLRTKETIAYFLQAILDNTSLDYKQMDQRIMII